MIVFSRLSKRLTEQEQIEKQRDKLDQETLPPFCKVMDELTAIEHLMKEQRNDPVRIDLEPAAARF